MSFNENKESLEISKSGEEMNQTDEGTENLWRMVADDLSQMFRGDPAQEPNMDLHLPRPVPPNGSQLCTSPLEFLQKTPQPSQTDDAILSGSQAIPKDPITNAIEAMEVDENAAGWMANENLSSQNSGKSELLPSAPEEIKDVLDLTCQSVNDESAEVLKTTEIPVEPKILPKLYREYNADVFERLILKNCTVQVQRISDEETQSYDYINPWKYADPNAKSILITDDELSARRIHKTKKRVSFINLRSDDDGDSPRKKKFKITETWRPIGIRPIYYDSTDSEEEEKRKKKKKLAKKSKKNVVASDSDSDFGGKKKKIKSPKSKPKEVKDKKSADKQEEASPSKNYQSSGFPKSKNHEKSRQNGTTNSDGENSCMESGSEAKAASSPEKSNKNQAVDSSEDDEIQQRSKKNVLQSDNDEDSPQKPKKKFTKLKKIEIIDSGSSGEEKIEEISAKKVSKPGPRKLRAKSQVEKENLKKKQKSISPVDSDDQNASKKSKAKRSLSFEGEEGSDTKVKPRKNKKSVEPEKDEEESSDLSIDLDSSEISSVSQEELDEELIIQPLEISDLLTEESLSLVKAFINNATKLSDLHEPYKKIKLRESIKFSPSMDLYLLHCINENPTENVFQIIFDKLKENSLKSLRIFVLEFEDLKIRFKEIVEALKSGEEQNLEDITIEFLEDTEIYMDEIGQEPFAFKDFQFANKKLSDIAEIFEICLKSERTKLLEQFSSVFDWNLREFKQFLSATEQYGTEITDKFSKFIPNKSLKQIKEYGEVFWKRFHEIKSVDVSKVVSNAIFKKHEAFYDKISNDPTDFDELVYIFRGYAEYKFDRRFDEILLKNFNKKTSQELREMMPVKCSFYELVQRFENLMQSAEIYYNEKENKIFEDPRSSMLYNEAFTTEEEYLETYQKPILNVYHFYPPDLHKLIEKEFKFVLDLKDGKIEPFKNPIKPHVRDKMQKYRRQGFPTWTEREIKRFFKGIEAVGLKNPKKLSKIMKTRSILSVQKYSKALTLRYHEIPDEDRKNLIKKCLKETKCDSDSDFMENNIEDDLNLLKAANKGCLTIQNVQIPYSAKDDPDKFQKKLDRGLVWLMSTRNFESEDSFFQEIQKTVQKEAKNAGNIKSRCLELIEKFKIHISTQMKTDLEEDKKIRKLKNPFNKKVQFKDFHFHPNPARLEELLERDYLYKLSKRQNLEAYKKKESHKKEISSDDEMKSFLDDSEPENSAGRKKKSNNSKNRNSLAEVEAKLKELKKNPPKRLSKFEFAEMKSLLSNGFTDWTSNDLTKLLRAAKKFSITNYDEISESLDNKDAKVVKSYSEVLWKRHKELKNEAQRTMIQEILQKENEKFVKFLTLSKEILENVDEFDAKFEKDEKFSEKTDEIIVEALKNVDLQGNLTEFYDNLLADLKTSGEKVKFDKFQLGSRCKVIMKAYNSKIKSEGKRLSAGKVESLKKSDKIGKCSKPVKEAKSDDEDKDDGNLDSTKSSEKSVNKSSGSLNSHEKGGDSSGKNTNGYKMDQKSNKKRASSIKEKKSSSKTQERKLKPSKTGQKKSSDESDSESVVKVSRKRKRIEIESSSESDQEKLVIDEKAASMSDDVDNEIIKIAGQINVHIEASSSSQENDQKTSGNNSTNLNYTPQIIPDIKRRKIQFDDSDSSTQDENANKKIPLNQSRKRNLDSEPEESPHKAKKPKTFCGDKENFSLNLA